MSTASKNRRLVQGRLFTHDDAAERMGCSVTTIRRLRAAGELATVRVGSLVRIPEASIDEYLARQLSGGAE